MILSLIGWKTNSSESDSNDIVSCAFIIGVLFFKIENDFYNYIFIVTIYSYHTWCEQAFSPRRKFVKQDWNNMRVR